MRSVQGLILVTLVVISGLLYSISRKLTAPAPAPSAVSTPAAAPAVTSVPPQAAAPLPSLPMAQSFVPPSAAVPAGSSFAEPQYESRRPSPFGPPVSRRAAPLPAPRRQVAAAPAYAQAPAYPPAEAAPPAYISAPPTPPAPPPVRTITVPAGQAISVRLLDRISTEHNRQGDPFQASLDEPLVADGVVVASRGATVMGHVVQARQSGRVAGLAEMALELDRLQTVGGEVQIASDTMIRQAPTSHGKDAATVGGLAGIGAAIGAIAGGRKGAGIGAAAGGAAGAGTVMATRGKPVNFEPETRLTFRLRAPITISAENGRLQAATVVDDGRLQGPPPDGDYDRPRLKRRQ